MKPKAIIFDIDGTLSDCRHRLHHLPNYAKFFDAMKDDAPIGGVVELLEMCHTSGWWNGDCSIHILLVTGRPDSHIDDTLHWLLKYDIYHDRLYMRADGDHRPDHVVKDEIRQAIEKEYEIVLVIDDRPKVVDMWRKAGYVCLQNEYRQLPDYPSGKLFVMVGPSGAGKDTWIDVCSGATLGFVPHQRMVVSSDELRWNICGNFQDQSKNEQVFALFHSLVKTTLEHGGNVVANATHIKNKDRLATVACAPADAKIEYIVIDRPLQDKIRDAGWRKGVMVKGQSLIEYHHNTMQSNLKDILAGDNDPRVTVRDLRIV